MTRFPYGKNVLITGGSSGIGLAAAELFAVNGYIVYAASRTPDEETRLFTGGGEIRPVALDVRDGSSAADAVSNVLSQADVGIVIHCAGIGIACAAEESPPDEVAGLMDTNFFGVLNVNRSILPHLRERGGGLCVMIGSMAGIFPIPFQAHYSASKAAIDMYAAALRTEMREYGVRVSLVMPGDTQTGFTGARKYAIDETSPYYSGCVKTTGKMEKDERGGASPLTAARVIFRLSGMKKPPRRRIVGFDYKILAFLNKLLPDRIVEFALRLMYI